MKLFVRGLAVLPCGMCSLAAVARSLHFHRLPARIVAKPPAAERYRQPPDAADVARFRIGETVIVTFSGIADRQFRSHEEPIKEDGTITLPLIGPVYAVGKTAGELQNEIQTNYVPKYYVRLTVTVKSGDRVYYVGGEVSSPGRQLYVGDTTVTKAIQSAGGLTDFANHGKVWLTRATTGQRIRVNYDKALENPAKDPPVYPDDQINVDTRLF